MARTITVKGIGKASAKPDYVVLSMELESKSLDYEKAMQEASEKIEFLNESLMQIGFGKESIKTTNFYVRSDYESHKDKFGNYSRIFSGYAVCHRLKIEFDFNSKLLSKALSSVASCIAKPELSVSFTVKDPTAVNEALLKSAAENAKKKAQILCGASGKMLGELVNINYNWAEVNIYSATHYDMDAECMKACADASYSIDIEPEDIAAKDTATFVWEIE